MLLNYDFSFTRNNKIIFVQSDEGRRKGERILEFVENRVDLPPNFFHYRRGGHVAALHRHLENSFFFRIDLQNFFYSISRNRIASALYHYGFGKARTYAKWSCVKNPLSRNPGYVLPIGFVQSPALASLALMRSPVATVIDRAMDAGVYVSVYMDDLIGSARELASLEEVYEAMLDACDAANFPINKVKLISPATEIKAFNCNLQHKFVEVAPERIAKFFEEPRSPAAASAFSAYCKAIMRKNVAA